VKMYGCWEHCTHYYDGDVQLHVHNVCLLPLLPINATREASNTFSSTSIIAGNHSHTWSLLFSHINPQTCSLSSGISKITTSMSYMPPLPAALVAFFANDVERLSDMYYVDNHDSCEIC
jgi:hypothetical protein